MTSKWHHSQLTMIEKLEKEFVDDEYVKYAESPTTGRDSAQFVPPLMHWNNLSSRYNLRNTQDRLS